MTFLRILWGIDVLILVIALYFFFTGIGTATPGSKFFSTWMVFLGVLIGVLAGSFALGTHGYLTGAKLLAGLPAGLGAMYVLFMLVVIFSGGRWN